MMDFDYYDEYFNKYIKRNIVMTMLRKANFTDWWKTIKVKEDQGEKLIQNLIFFQASKCSKGFKRKECRAYYRILFASKSITKSRP